MTAGNLCIALGTLCAAGCTLLFDSSAGDLASDAGETDAVVDEDASASCEEVTPYVGWTRRTSLHIQYTGVDTLIDYPLLVPITPQMRQQASLQDNLRDSQMRTVLSSRMESTISTMARLCSPGSAFPR